MSDVADVMRAKFDPTLEMVKDRINKGSDEISQSIGNFLQFYKSGNDNMAHLRNELSVIKDTVQTNSATGQKLNLPHIKELAVDRISESAAEMKALKRDLATDIEHYETVLKDLRHTEMDIKKMKAHGFGMPTDTKRSEVEHILNDKTPEKLYVK
ncbi:hypothetical protein RF11_00305 [Thelohanellus kitauei]|uniref:Uncharacterized protein n=1 Tax=Thelohanellus kitauei TaxID=669202 RepID=A0A0C2NE10_THEKT|nr:hypothetical protein RF11_00305 [Thelohanellus kitauei]